jgi:8-amino-7-oxononanoate synthase
MRFPKKLNEKLDKRAKTNALRSLHVQHDLIDFSSNDYLGIARNKEVFINTHNFLVKKEMFLNGATGSRLLSGNHALYPVLEDHLKTFHNAEDAIVFNSGYDANVGFFSSVPQRGDIIIYDELIHASIRDGIKMSDAKSYKFKHNDIEDLERILDRVQNTGAVYVVTETVFSMDGDIPDLVSMAEVTQKNNAYFVVDEAHALGVFGQCGVGIVQELGIANTVFARIITFGKALGSHGAAILGSTKLIAYLTNFSRSFIYTTALSPHAVATIYLAYCFLETEEGKKRIKELQENIVFFKKKVAEKKLQKMFISSDSSIHCCVISGNEKVKYLAQQIQGKGFDVKPILSPTVAEGQERLRFCLHAYNSKKEIEKVLEMLAIFAFEKSI